MFVSQWLMDDYGTLSIHVVYNFFIILAILSAISLIFIYINSKQKKIPLFASCILFSGFIVFFVFGHKYLFDKSSNPIEFHQKYASDTQKQNLKQCVNFYRFENGKSEQDVLKTISENGLFKIIRFCEKSEEIALLEQQIKQTKDPCVTLYKQDFQLSDRQIAIMFDDRKKEVIEKYCRAKKALAINR